MQALYKINSYMKTIEQTLMVLTVGGMTALLIVNVFFRFVLNNSISFAEELGGILMIACVYFGSPYCVRRSKHVRMTALIEKMPQKVGKCYSILIDLITAAVFIFLAYHVYQYCFDVYKMASKTVALRIPRWVCILPVVIGTFFTGLQYLFLVIMNLIDKENYWIGTERRMGEPDID